MQRCHWAIGFALCLAAGVYSSENDDSGRVSHGGYASLEAGQIVAGQFKTDTIAHVWQNRLLGGYSITAHVGSRLQVNVSMECLLAFAVVNDKSNYATDPEAYRGHFVFYPNRLDGIYSLGDSLAGLSADIGYFPFTYNHDVRNLGEYLFRGHCYPGYLMNDFDAVYKRLLGIHLEGRLFGWLRQDLLLTSSVIDNPAQDFDLSYLAAATVNHVLEVGAGVSLEHFFSVNEDLTTPKSSQNIFIRNADTIQVGGAGGYDSIVGDTGYYTFRGVKIMGRVSFDPKGLFGSGILGAEDLKIYAEACVLGIQNQGDFYDDIMRRIPVAVGFNVPAFRLLDVVAVEAEWYDSKYSNNYQRTFILPQSLPVPVDDPKEPAKAAWYWSVYAKRTLAKGWSLIGQVAHDHVFTYNYDQFFQDRREALPKAGDWHWVVKSQFSF